MRKAIFNYNRKLNFLMLAILAIAGIVFATGIYESPEFLITLITVIPITFLVDGKFKELSKDELKKLIEDPDKVDDLAIYFNELNEHKEEVLNRKMEEKADKTEIEALRTELFESRDTQMKQILEIIKTQKVQGLQMAQNQKSVMVKGGEFRKSLKEAVDKLKEEKKKGSKDVFINVEVPIIATKAVGTMLESVSLTGEIPQSEREPGYTNLTRRTFNLRDGANVFPISSNLASWIEQRAKEGSAAMTAEGSVKSQVDWTYVEVKAAVRKITCFVKISDEMLEDLDGMMGEINGELLYQIMLVESTGLMTGDGAGLNLLGLEHYAQPLDLAALAGTVPSPNRWDVLGAAITQIEENGNGEFYATRIFLRPVDIFLAIHATKSTTTEYINPVTVVPNPDPRGMPTVFIWGVPVVPSRDMTAGEFMVADMARFTIRDKGGIVIQVGLDANDFTLDLVTIRAVKRLVSYAKTNHVEAFVHDTFADGETFLEASS